jgi:hypothetical protein
LREREGGRQTDRERGRVEGGGLKYLDEDFDVGSYKELQQNQVTSPRPKPSSPPYPLSYLPPPGPVQSQADFKEKQFVTNRGARYLTGDGVKAVWGKFSTLS